MHDFVMRETPGECSTLPYVDFSLKIFPSIHDSGSANQKQNKYGFRTGELNSLCTKVNKCKPLGSIT